MSDQHENVHGNSYVVDAENGAELLRLLEQDRMTTKGMGGLFPERQNLEGIERILDLGCGPGGWVQEVAFAYPDVEVLGVDISKSSIEYARAQARVQQLKNAHFEVMDIKQPLPFPAASFDLVNARYICGFLGTSDWATLLEKCMHILRPGGILRITEAEWDLVNTPALARILGLFTQALALSDRTFSPGGQNGGIVHVLPRFFRKAGLQQTQTMAHAIEFSAGTPYHGHYFRDIQKALVLLEPFLVGMGVTTGEELEQLTQQAMAEILSEDFCAMWLLVTVWGQKLENAE